jgi:hypothetical protein
MDKRRNPLLAKQRFIGAAGRQSFLYSHSGRRFWNHFYGREFLGHLSSRPLLRAVSLIGWAVAVCHLLYMLG